MQKFILSLLTAGCITAVSTVAVAQNDDSLSTVEFTPAEEMRIEENQVSAGIDSLLSLWYIKNTIDSKDVSTKIDSNAVPVFYSDSIYEACLKQIPTTFPLVYNQKVKDWIEMYIRRGKYLMPMLLSMSQYYFPMIEPVFDKYDIPLELKYLTIVESALNPRAVSRAGATGLWQFMYGTGKMYGLEINSLVDERRDPAKETEAAAKFLKDLYDIYGDWALVIAAYNCGPGNVNKAIKRSGGKTNFWDIYKYLPMETRGYVPAFISVNYLMNFYKQHNYVAVPVQMPTYTDTVTVNKKLHFGQVSEMLGISMDLLRDLNPQYKKDIIPGQLSPAPLRLPADYAVRFADQEKQIYAYKDSIYFAPQNGKPEFRQTATTTAARSTTSTTAHHYDPCDASIPAGSTKLVYTVKQGDTFGFISNWYDVKITKLKCWNNISGNNLKTGQKLTVYVPTKKLNAYKNINTMTFEQKQAQKSNAIVAQSSASGKTLDKNFEYYTIRKGDNLSTIAARYQGITDQDIMKINGFTAADVRRLQIGQVIKIRRRN